MSALKPAPAAQTQPSDAKAGPGGGTPAAVAEPTATPLEEYKHLGLDLRHYEILRLYRLTLLLGTTGAMLTALSGDAVRAHPVMFEIIKVGGLIITVAFAVMDYRSSQQWWRMQTRSNVLAEALGFEQRPISNLWSPMTTTGAGRVLHLFLVSGWTFVQFLPLLQR